MNKLILFFGLLLQAALTQAQQMAATVIPATPSVGFEKWLSLSQAGTAVLSPDGANIAYTVTSTDWKENRYDAEIWLSLHSQPPFPLTNNPKGSSTSPKWSPDSKWIAFLSDRGDKSQIYLISAEGGEAFPLTREDENINAFSWSPDGQQIAFTRNDADSKTVKAVKDHYGAFAEEGKEYKLSHLWTIRFSIDSLTSPPSGDSSSFPRPTRLTSGNFTVTDFKWSPDGRQIACNRQPDPLIPSSIHASIDVLDKTTGKVQLTIADPAGDELLAWSPDGNSLLYGSFVDDTTSQYYKNNRLFIRGLSTSITTAKEIAASFDEEKSVVDWNPKGIFFIASQRTKVSLFHLDPATGEIGPVPLSIDVIGNASFSKDGLQMAFSGRSYTGLTEIYSPSGQLTHLSAQLKGWPLPANEVIQWKSKDGAAIEGILLKPANYDEKKKYPLLVVIHGGPTGVDRPEPVPTYVYPIMQWCEKGALVLRVNYRGSAGYGEKFRSLNVRNLGVGDMWDVLSGIDYLNKKGIIDTARMGCMGWSQGGYISAFLTTHTPVFKAISVGAGISDWATYYVSTDITPFTREYLKATPWEDKAIYEKTSPITAINQAHTPTLIQHGELDRRVPISDAYELYRGLQDRNIPSRLFVYKGFGHGITKPKERLAAIWHNWQWFGKYIWGEEVTLP
ncbi:MAG TPA: S9 family peptidase [Puia sp.]|nr:S9 family peptidase [Puia sp.]